MIEIYKGKQGGGMSLHYTHGTKYDLRFKFVPSNTLFRCRICEELTDDGDFKGQICLRCIDTYCQKEKQDN